MAKVGFGRTFAQNRSVGSRIWHFLVNVVAASGFVTEEQRVSIYRFCSIPVGTGVKIKPRCHFFSANIEIAAEVHLGDDIEFDNRDRITLKPGSGISAGCALLTSGHAIGPPERRAGPYMSAPITLEEGAWLGYGVTVLAGVTIGRGSVVAAGAVVTGDIPPNSLVGGVPARVIRAIE